MKALKDYGFIKGVNSVPKDAAAAARNLGYAKKIGLNSIRYWLDPDEYEKDPDGYKDFIKAYAAVCEDNGFTMVPILFNGNMLDPAKLEEAYVSRGEKYCDDMIALLGKSEALLMWDVMNEPACNDYINKDVSEEEQKERLEKLWKFVRHFCAYVKEKDPSNAITVGHYMTKYLEASADLVDVISYHNYSGTVRAIRGAAEEALAVGKKYGKCVINNEMSCVARANPYDVTIQIMDEYKIPWYVFCLMIEGYWGEVHGIFYPDGTVRDPSIPAAVTGCFRNRDLSTMVLEKPDREKQARSCIERLKKQLADNNEDVFAYREETKAADLLETMEEMANLLEAGQMVPMRIPPTAKVYAFERQKEPNLEELRAYAYELAKQLTEACHILGAV